MTVQVRLNVTQPSSVVFHLLTTEDGDPGTGLDLTAHTAVLEAVPGYTVSEGLLAGDLTPNADIDDPSGTVWRATVRQSMRDSRTLHFVVPTGQAGPLWVTDLLTDAPLSPAQLDLLAVETAARIAADGDLQDQIDALEVGGGGDHPDVDHATLATAASVSALDVRLDVIEALGSLATDAELAAEAASRAAADTALDGRVDHLEAVAVRPEAHGALGDGTTDDTLALRAAIATGKALAFTPGATYLYSGALSLQAAQHVDGNGATLKRAAQVSSATTTAVTSGVTTSVTVADASAFRVGMDVVLVVSAGSWDTSNRRITAIVGNVITVSTAFGLTAASGATLYSSTYGLVLAGRNHVRGVRFDGNKANVTFYRWQNTFELEVIGDHNLIEGCVIDDAPGEGIVAFGSHNTISACVLTDLNGNGIHFGESTHVVVDRCRVVNANLDTVVGHADGGIIWSNTIAHATISGCYVENAICGIGSIDSTDNSDVTIIGNTIRSCTGTAIEGTCPDGQGPGNVVIVGNRIYDSVKVAISRASGASSTYPNHVIFANNHLSGTWVDVSNARYVTVRGNVIEDTGDTTTNEVNVGDSKWVAVEGNTIVGGSYGVYVTGSACEAVLVAGNNLVGQRNGAIRFETASTPGCEASGNVVTADSAAASTYNGILVRAQHAARGNFVNLTSVVRSGIYPQNGAVVAGNTVRHGSSTYSIRADGGTSGIVIKGNYLTAAVSNGGGTSNLVAENAVEGALANDWQALDADLTAIAALTTTSFGRSFLDRADAAAGRTLLGLGTAATSASGDFQPADSDLTAIAALATTAFGRSVLERADAAALRTLAGLVIGTDVQAYDADLADIAGLADAQGDILVRGASGWERLAKSATATDVLTAGASQPAWAAPSGGGGSVATDAIFDAKGDLAVGTGADAASKLAVGTNGQRLTADSTQATGLKWTTPTPRDPLLPTGYVAQTLRRETPLTNQTALTSGTLRLQAIWLEAGEVVSTVAFTSGNTSAGTPLNQWASLWDASRNRLATSADQTTSAWGTTTLKTFDFVAGSGAYTVTASGLYYVGLVVVATTVPNLSGLSTASVPAAQPPILAGNSSTGQTTPGLAPATAAAITASGTLIWAAAA